MAELLGVYYGLLMAWESKVQRVEVEVDSEMVVGFLKTGISEVLCILCRSCYVPDDLNALFLEDSAGVLTLRRVRL
ncbi:unnamed protein product [Microthlaspi erraticum]|uniref:RNase H type-1 domain-containing protein n=1 Tax=Microthlaspi erraticum TaxID=1685480 RepID=A0A6D2JPQ5_9BRAS|nr:unnamed protein product [Microthlaspi erraticum]